MLFLSLFLLSCQKDDEDHQPHDDYNRYDVHIGKYELLESSILSMPYREKSGAVFIDSAGNETTFSITQFGLFSPKGVLYRYSVHSPGDTVRYGFEAEAIHARIENEQLNVNFWYGLQARPYYPDPESGYVADVTDVSLQYPDEPLRSSQIFTQVTNQRTWPTMSGSTDTLAEYWCHGLKYENVLHGSFSNPLSDVYFNYQYGIVSFTDHDGQKWALTELY